ncbi:vesicle transport protein GOT1 isoform X3 [Amborella trichopoda]|uniref:vesicle transport protein GOT1 isoform X3 n=1 Tax=Amborella trichopoda TaxID=13333 RepID=UPI0009BD3666|nr:vesicle transport protein GOT1 isoform X3 [Amborella trichopoda]XP_020531996.1 vesicle transport protein GOT1 isoform X3 [Amborella trichopoda]|eukprot:XP_020531995.1 vesicle transport protein GOT1 isoform X3 [Amborella trichopoda]
MAYEINEQKKIGIGLIGFGITFTFLGVILFFDMGLLALGNIFCLSGVAVLLGWHSTWQLFTRRTSYKDGRSKERVYNVYISLLSLFASTCSVIDQRYKSEEVLQGLLYAGLKLLTSLVAAAVTL